MTTAKDELARALDDSKTMRVTGFVIAMTTADGGVITAAHGDADCFAPLLLGALEVARLRLAAGVL